MGIMVYSLLWVMQDLYHQPYFFKDYVQDSEGQRTEQDFSGCRASCDLERSADAAND